MSASSGQVEFVAGTVAGFCGKLVEHPFDTVKVLLQAQHAAPTSATRTVRYNGVWHCISHTYKHAGIPGLYKGLTSPLLGSTFEVAVLFAVVAKNKALLGEREGGPPLPLISCALAGAGGGVVVPCVLTPVELIKCRLQVQQALPHELRTYKGPLDCIIKTIREEGIVKGLYRGNTATLLREIPGCFAWYGSYEMVCRWFSRLFDDHTEHTSPLIHMFSGGFAGVAYWTSGYWADTVKTRIQTKPALQGVGFSHVLRDMLATEGIRGLYRGWLVTCFRAFPAHAMMFVAYENSILYLKPAS